jgi:hypothetical protein
MAASLDRHPGSLGFEIFEHLPQIRGKHIVLLDPSNLAFRGANFHLILIALEHVQALAEGQGCDGLADLRRGAPNGDLFIAGVGDFDGRRGVMKTKVKSDRKNQHHRGAEQDFSYQDPTPNTAEPARTTNFAKE